nr:MAG TPA: hypothetical protein [Caudoviricetes sp.]
MCFLFYSHFGFSLFFKKIKTYHLAWFAISKRSLNGVMRRRFVH